MLGSVSLIAAPPHHITFNLYRTVVLVESDILRLVQGNGEVGVVGG